LFVDVFPGKLGEVYSELEKHSELTDMSIVLGEHDIIAKLDFEDPERLYGLSSEICSMKNVQRAGIYTGFRYKSNGFKPEEYKYRAWVLISARDPTLALDKLLTIEGMVEACAIGGEWSIIADMVGNSFEDIGRKVIEIQKIDGVTRTETLAAFPKQLVEEVRGLVVAH
jgi:DNA-binding Lrp family transcriptional regulator